MNLINDPWLPVRRKSGAVEHIRPAQIVSDIGKDPIVSIASGRADLDAGGLLFLVGLLSTAFAPESDYEWHALAATPPSEDELHAAFGEYAHAFNLDGDGPRFMQDLTLLDDLDAGDVEKSTAPILSKLVGGPSGSAINQNRASIPASTWTAPIDRVSASTAALSLCTHWFAPPYGGGFRGTARGSSPVTVVALSKVRTLWHTLWLNVLGAEDLRGDTHSEAVFPWLDPVKGGKSPEPLAQENLSPLHVFWPMARRARLVFEGEGRCGITGEVSDQTVPSVVEVRGGANYVGLWVHPMSPMLTNKEGELYPMQARAQKGGGTTRFGWTSWPHAMSNQTAPATIRTIRDCPMRRALYDGRVAIFAYIADQSKVVDFISSEMVDVQTDAGRVMALRLIDAARQARGILIGGLRDSISSNVGKKGAQWSQISDRFYDRVEMTFYSCTLMADTGDPESISAYFFSTVDREVRRAFDEAIGDRMLTDPVKPAVARRDMTKKINTFVKKALGLGGKK